MLKPAQRIKNKGKTEKGLQTCLSPPNLETWRITTVVGGKLGTKARCIHLSGMICTLKNLNNTCVVPAH